MMWILEKKIKGVMHKYLPASDFIAGLFEYDLILPLSKCQPPGATWEKFTPSFQLNFTSLSSYADFPVEVWHVDPVLQTIITK